VARLKGVELIVMGSHRPVWARSVLGGTLDRVLRHAGVDVAVLIDKQMPESPSAILAPCTGTPHDRLAVTLAARLAHRCGGALTVLRVVVPGTDAAAAERDTRAQLAAAADVPSAATAVRVVESLDPIDAVIAEAVGYDLTVLGVDDAWQLTGSLLALRSERVAVEIPTSLLIVRSAQPT